MDQTSPGVDVSKLSMGEVFRGLKRMSLSSALWLIGGLCAAGGFMWTAGMWYEQTFGSRVTSAVSSGGEPPLTYPQSGGITKIANGFSNEQLKHFLMTAKSELTVVVPWFIDPLTIGDALKEILARDGTSVTVFFLDPASPHLAERGRVARPDLSNYGPGETRRSIAVLGPLFASAKANARLLTYNSIPSAFIVRADAKALIGFHMHTGVALKTPIILFDVFADGELTPFGRMITEEFTKLKGISRAIDAASVHEGNSGSIEFSYKNE